MEFCLGTGTIHSHTTSRTLGDLSHMRLDWHLWAASCAVALCVAGCSSGGDSALDIPPKDSELFAGFTPEIVAEVLADPGTRESVALAPESAQGQVWQTNVAQYGACRPMAQAYGEWLRTGSQPAFPEWAKPTHPEPNFNEFTHELEQSYREAYESLDPSEFRATLTAEVNCASWTPAKPGDYRGPTIADELP